MNPSALSLQEMILRVAYEFHGLREIRPNADWDNPDTTAREVDLSRRLKQLMRPSPWQEGWAYCAAFCEGVVVEALRRLSFSERDIAKFSRPMGPGVVRAYRALRDDGAMSTSPAPGSIFFWELGSTGKGHAGFVVNEISWGKLQKITTIEANTSYDNSRDEEANRNGDWITTKTRGVSRNGRFTTLGFCSPADILRLCQS